MCLNRKINQEVSLGYFAFRFSYEFFLIILWWVYDITIYGIISLYWKKSQCFCFFIHSVILIYTNILYNIQQSLVTDVFLSINHRLTLPPMNNRKTKENDSTRARNRIYPAQTITNAYCVYDRAFHINISQTESLQPRKEKKHWSLCKLRQIRVHQF